MITLSIPQSRAKVQKGKLGEVSKPRLWIDTVYPEGRPRPFLEVLREQETTQKERTQDL